MKNFDRMFLFLIFISADIYCMNRNEESAKFLSKLDRLFTYDREEEDTKSIVKEMNDASGNNNCLELDFTVYEKRRYAFQAKFLAKVCERITLGSQVAGCFIELMKDVPIIAACMNGKIDIECPSEIMKKRKDRNGKNQSKRIKTVKLLKKKKIKRQQNCDKASQMLIRQILKEEVKTLWSGRLRTRSNSSLTQ
jgi:hypothetical protein